MSVVTASGAVRIRVTGARGPIGPGSGPLGNGSVGADEISADSGEQEAITAKLGAAALSDLASTGPGKGLALSAFRQTGSGAIDRTGLEKAQEIVSALDFDGVGDETADDLAALNAAIIRAGDSAVVDLAGLTYRVSALPTNPRGVRFVNGRVVLGTAGAARQLNSYARERGFVHGREHLTRLYARAGSAGTRMKIISRGDSKGAHTSGSVQGYIVSNILTVTSGGDGELYQGCTISGSGVGSGRTVVQINRGFGGKGSKIQVSAGSDAGSSGSPITITTPGSGGGYAGNSGTPDVLLPKMLKRMNVANPIDVRNLNQGGTKWTDCDPTTFLAADVDATIFDYSTNHVNAQNVDDEIAAMRAVLTTLRAQTYGAKHLHDAILKMPISAHDTSGGRMNTWSEKLFRAYLQASDDFHACLIDDYGMWPDSSSLAGQWGDTPFVHPSAVFQQQISAHDGRELFPFGALAMSVPDDWVYLDPSLGGNSYTIYDNGFDPIRTKRVFGGKCLLRGGVAPPSNTVAANHTFALLPNTNYYPQVSEIVDAHTFSTTNTWGRLKCGVGTDGKIFAREAASNIVAVLFGMGSDWETW